MSLGPAVGEAIIVEHLRPAQEDTLAEVAALAPKFERLDMSSVDGRLRAPRTQAEAALRLDDLRTRYARIREARRKVLTIIGGTRHDHDDTFGEVKDIRYGDRWQGRHVTTWRPYPADPLTRLLWLATEAEAWMPTPAEQDAWWEAQTEDTRIKSGQYVTGRTIAAPS